MRRLALLVLLAILLVFPVPAHAQSGVTIETLSVQIWPDYDQPAVLVMYDFSMAAGTVLPAEVSLRVPKTASVLALAEHSGNDLLTVRGQQSADGDYLAITFTVDKPTTYRLEYYLPFTQMGAVRSFAFVWPGDYAVNKLTVSLQEPVGASNLKSEPELTESQIGQDGLVYHTSSYANYQAGQVYTLLVNYQKNDNALSVGASKVQPVEPVEQAEGRSASLTDSLPWVLGGLGVVLIVGGIAWYQLGGQTRRKSAVPQRKRHKQEEPKADEAVYCPQCGKRATGNDRFCRACGGKLRRDE